MDSARLAGPFDRLARFVTVLSLAAAIFGSRAAAMDWLSAPKQRFEGERPLDLLVHQGLERLEDEHDAPGPSTGRKCLIAE